MVKHFIDYCHNFGNRFFGLAFLYSGLQHDLETSAPYLNSVGAGSGRHWNPLHNMGHWDATKQALKENGKHT